MAVIRHRLHDARDPKGLLVFGKIEKRNLLPDGRHVAEDTSRQRGGNNGTVLLGKDSFGITLKEFIAVEESKEVGFDRKMGGNQPVLLVGTDKDVFLVVVFADAAYLFHIGYLLANERSGRIATDKSAPVILTLDIVLIDTFVIGMNTIGLLFAPYIEAKQQDEYEREGKAYDDNEGVEYVAAEEFEISTHDSYD
ncbi:hypothetical protein HMPREF1989_00360 [Porphyromonas gingivalis F0566]|nr:hypothetical protein HMPREF1989_00360 [Porphyromonas gingivalis F0566]